MKLTKGYGFVIDTNEYSGNFEREMCAHITGRTGECEVGDEFVNDLITEQFDNVIDVEDRGCSRPCSIYKSPKSTSNNSVIIYFDSEPTEEQISLMKERAYTFNEARKTVGNMAQFYKDSNIKILGFRLLEVKQNIEETEL